MAENIPPTENREEKSVITTEHLEPVTVYGNVVSRVVSSDELVTFNKVKKTTSGQLRVKKDSTSNNISVFVANPDIPPSEGSSGKHILCSYVCVSASYITILYMMCTCVCLAMCLRLCVPLCMTVCVFVSICVSGCVSVCACTRIRVH